MTRQRAVTDTPPAVPTPAAHPASPGVKTGFVFQGRAPTFVANAAPAYFSPVASAQNVDRAGAPVMDHGRVAVHPQQAPNTAPDAPVSADHAFLQDSTLHGGDFYQGAPAVHQPEKPPTQDISPFLDSFGQDLFFTPGTQLPNVSDTGRGTRADPTHPLPAQPPQQPRHIFGGPSSSWMDPQLVQLLLQHQQQQQQQQRRQQQQQQRQQRQQQQQQQQQPHYAAYRMDGSGNPEIVILQAPVASDLSGWSDARVAGGINPPNSHDADASVYMFDQPSVAPMPPLYVETPHADNVMAATLEFGDGSRGGGYVQPTMDLSCGMTDAGIAYSEDIKPGASLLRMAYYPEDIRRAEIDFCSRQPGAAGAAAHTAMSSAAVAAAALEAAMLVGEDTKPDITKQPYRVGTQAGPAIIKATQRWSRGESPRRRLKHVCKFCAKVLDTRYKLERHLRTHTGERPFECKKCQTRFNQKSSLKTHSNIHAREALKDPDTTGDMVGSIKINGYSLDQLGIPYAKHVINAIHKVKAESKRKKGASA